MTKRNRPLPRAVAETVLVLCGLVIGIAFVTEPHADGVRYVVFLAVLALACVHYAVQARRSWREWRAQRGAPGPAAQSPAE
ncbi:hypothetical protein ACIRQY_19730 [Streptomyces sp. NPDC101490]|uniref:hypothetical protein n=1 Tax=Streptomyces sp. NPDC101490 TaxID=3366143 RepID=UPI00382FB8B0